MAGRYGAGVTNKAGVNTADTAYFQIRATATTERIAVVEIIFAILTAPTNAPQPYLTRTTAIGTVTTTIAGQAFDPADAASLTTLDSAFSVAPTFTAANKVGVGALAVTAGGAWVWSFRDKPLILPASTTAGLAIVNAAASGATVGAFSCSAIFDE